MKKKAKKTNKLSKQKLLERRIDRVLNNIVHQNAHYLNRLRKEAEIAMEPITVKNTVDQVIFGLREVKITLKQLGGLMLDMDSKLPKI